MQLNRKGVATLWVIGLGLFVGMAALVVPSLLRRTATVAFDAERQFEAQVLAANVREIAKYLILYEKVFYTGAGGGLLGGAGDPLAIDANIRRVWSQSFTEMDAANADLIHACGGYSLGASYLGTHQLGAGSLPVFCPFYFRTHLFTGPMAEQLLFERWASKNPVVTRPTGQAGTYQLTIDFTPSLAPAAGKLLGLDTGSRIVQEGIVDKVEAVVTFSTDSGGFRAVAAERYINVAGRVWFSGRKIQGAAPGSHYVEDSETIMMTLSTPKEFALFLMYPPNPGIPAVGARDFSQNVTFPADTKVYGRTFFNGDIDLGADVATGLDKLPTFYDAVVLTGNLRPVPGPGTDLMTKLQAHFRKGLVTNFSPARYLYTGTCAAGEGLVSPTYVDNHSTLGCALPAGYPAGTDPACEIPDMITNYLADPQLYNPCWPGTITIGTKDITYTYQAYQQDCPADPVPQDPACNKGQSPTADNPGVPDPATWITAAPPQTSGPSTMVAGGFNDIEVNNSYAFIISPVRTLNINNPGANVYGLVFGGQINAGVGGVSFYSLAALQAGPGMAGIPNTDTVSRVNGDAALAYEGVSVPLLNLPVVYSSKEGIR